MRRRRRVLLALQASANGRLADIRRCSRVIVVNRHVAGDLAQIRVAGCRVVRAQKITADHDARTREPAVCRAALNHNVAMYRDRTFEKREGAVLGQDAAPDHRWVLSPIDEKSRTGFELYVAADVCLRNRAGHTASHVDVAGDITR